MASSRKPQPNRVVDRVREALSCGLHRGARICVGLSGGMDSMALLDVLLRECGPLEFDLSALHVHHGISAHADEWARFCERACHRRGVPLRIEHVELGRWRRAYGVEAAARIARYGAFARLDVDAVLLAQHLDDQAETVLLQLLRGAGLPGLAAMGAERVDWSGALDAAAQGAQLMRLPKIVRPLLEVPRAQIAAYARQRRLRWVEDDTNDDLRFARNRLRREVMPQLTRLFPAAIANLGRSARHLAAAERLLAELGRTDLRSVRSARGLAVSRLLALGPDRGHNALRVWLRAHSAPALDAVQLDELWRQLGSVSRNRSMRFDWGRWSIERYRDDIVLGESVHAHGDARRHGDEQDQPQEQERDHEHGHHPQADRGRAESAGLLVPPEYRPPPREPLALDWQGERPWSIAPLGGTLRFRRVRGQGIASEHLRPGRVQVRSRAGGERIRLAANAGHRTLKNLFQEQAVPPSARARWPLVYVDGRLAVVPGIGCADTLRAGPGQPGWELIWDDAAAASGRRLRAPLEKSKNRAKIKS